MKFCDLHSPLSVSIATTTQGHTHTHTGTHTHTQAHTHTHTHTYTHAHAHVRNQKDIVDNMITQFPMRNGLSGEKRVQFHEQNISPTVEHGMDRSCFGLVLQPAAQGFTFHRS